MTKFIITGRRGLLRAFIEVSGVPVYSELFIKGKFKALFATRYALYDNTWGVIFEDDYPIYASKYKTFTLPQDWDEAMKATKEFYFVPEKVTVTTEKPIEKLEYEFEVGDWVVCKHPRYPTEVIKRVARVYDVDYAVGLDFGHEDFSCVRVFPNEFIRPATHLEISTHLIREAQRRGYKKGTVVQSLVHDKPLMCMKDDDKVWYIKEYDKLHWGSDQERDGSVKRVVIYKKGKWAEILSQP
jgi:hypothetical protein